MAKLTKDKPRLKLTADLKPYQRPGTVAYTAPPKKTIYKRNDYLASHDAKPLVYYSARAWDTVAFLVKECATELGWVGAVERINQFEYIVHDIRVMEQEAGPATFEYEDWNLPVTEMIMKGTMREGFIDANLGHSHVNMGVTPSGTDEEQMMDLMHPDKDGMPTSKFSIQTIHNKKGDYTCAIFDWENKVHYPNCDIKIMSSLNEEDIADLREQLKRVKKYTYTNYATNYGYGYNGTAKKKNPVSTINNSTIPAVDDYPLYDPYGYDDPAEAHENDYQAFMDNWDKVAWAEWQDGMLIADINADNDKRIKEDTA